VPNAASNVCIYAIGERDQAGTEGVRLVPHRDVDVALRTILDQPDGQYRLPMEVSERLVHRDPDAQLSLAVDIFLICPADHAQAQDIYAACRSAAAYHRYLHLA